MRTISHITHSSPPAQSLFTWCLPFFVLNHCPTHGCPTAQLTISPPSNSCQLGHYEPTLLDGNSVLTHGVLLEIEDTVSGGEGSTRWVHRVRAGAMQAPMDSCGTFQPCIIRCCSPRLTCRLLLVLPA